MKQTIPYGTYEHFKGTRYDVLGEATHSETGEELVLYTRQGIEEERHGIMWARPKKMFLGTLPDGTPRFRYVSVCSYAEPKEER